MAAKIDRLFEQALEHHRAGRLAKAAALYQEILRARPRDADALYLLGAVAHQAGQPERAVELMRRSLEISPDQARCYSVLGIDLTALGRNEEAEAAFERAIALEPSSELHGNLSALRTMQGRFEEAATGYRDALALNDGYTPALAGLGQALLKLGRAGEAAPHLQKAAAALPADAGIHCDLGDALQSLGKLDAALDAYRSALKHDPQLARAWYAAGCAESSRMEFTSAVACFRRALDLAPNWQQAQHNLGRALFKLGQIEDAMDQFRLAAAAGDPALPQSAIALMIPGDPRADNQAVADARRIWAAALPAGSPKLRRPRSDRLKIGYISAFFQDRNWMKPVWGLINRHDRERFEIHLFSDAPASRIEHGYRPHPLDQFHDASKLSNVALAERIEEAKIDILVDLNGYSAMERLSVIALRPAPVIVGWFNIYATTGMSAYDYLVGDARAIPPEEEAYYCEKILRVDGSYLTFEVTYPVPEVAEAPCLTNGGVTFGSLAPLYKITNGGVEAWSRILSSVPGSRMIVRNRELGSPAVGRFLLDLFARNGISEDRLRLEGPAEHYRFLETYDAIDIALDTFPYNGGTTTTEAIWQGVPVATFSGDRWVSRTSASILHAAGMEDLVGTSREGFESIAVALANAPQRLRDLRRGMRSRLQQSAACDTAGFAREMERIYTEIA